LGRSVAIRSPANPNSSSESSRSLPCGATTRHARSPPREHGRGDPARDRARRRHAGQSAARRALITEARTTCRLTLPLPLALSSLAFAPAPVPKRDREAASQKRQREVAALTRRLDELRVVRWLIDGPDGRPMLRFNRDHPEGRGGTGGAFALTDGDLASVLRR